MSGVSSAIRTRIGVPLSDAIPLSFIRGVRGVAGSITYATTIGNALVDTVFRRRIDFAYLY